MQVANTRVTTSVNFFTPNQQQLRNSPQAPKATTLKGIGNAATDDARVIHNDTEQTVTQLEGLELTALGRYQQTVANNVITHDQERVNQQTRFDNVLPIVASVPAAQPRINIVRPILNSQQDDFLELRNLTRQPGSLIVPELVTLDNELTRLKNARDTQVEPQLLQLERLAQRQTKEASETKPPSEPPPNPPKKKPFEGFKKTMTKFKNRFS
jgi:hypothetical protein